MIFSFAVPSARSLRPRWLLLPVVLAMGAPAMGGCEAALAGIAGSGGKQAAKQAISFDETGTIELQPREVRTLHLTTAPLTRVTLLLLGESLDGSLDQGSLFAGQDGHATVTLKAPSSPTSFHLVAHVGDANTGAVADLPVAVGDAGFATVRVLPKYLGSRQVSSWQASVSVGTTCDAVRAALPNDPMGALTASASPGGTPVIGSVPVGPSVAVAVRSGALTWGCVETTLDTPSTTRDLTLNVADTPMQLGAANLSLSLDYAPPQQSYATLLGKSEALLIDSAFPANANLATLVLDAMRENVPVALLQAFDQHRQANAVDASVASNYASAMVNPRAKLEEWAALVVPSPSGTQPLAIHGLLVGAKSSPGAPSFEVDAFGPVAAADAGVPVKVALTWMALPGDKVVAGGNLVFSPTRLVGHLMEKKLVAATPTLTSAVDGLAHEMNCDAVGMQAGGFVGCDATCGRTLCVAAMTTIWEKGLTSADDQGLVGIAVSSSAAVDESATPTSLTGSWVGNLSGLGATCAMTGNATAIAVPTP